jgi:hypothetical protein
MHCAAHCDAWVPRNLDDVFVDEVYFVFHWFFQAMILVLFHAIVEDNSHK